MMANQLKDCDTTPSYPTTLPTPPPPSPPPHPPSHPSLLILFAESGQIEVDEFCDMMANQLKDCDTIPSYPTTLPTPLPTPSPALTPLSAPLRRERLDLIRRVLRHDGQPAEGLRHHPLLPHHPPHPPPHPLTRPHTPLCSSSSQRAVRSNSTSSAT